MVLVCVADVVSGFAALLPVICVFSLFLPSLIPFLLPVLRSFRSLSLLFSFFSLFPFFFFCFSLFVFFLVSDTHEKPSLFM